MTQEQKAKRYDEALEKTRKKYNSRSHSSLGPSGVYLNNVDLEEIFPELRESESEDEMIRQWLYDLVDNGAFLCERPCATESILAYLEKQKEQPLTDEEKEYIRTIKSIISDFIRDKKPENLAYYQRIYDWLDGRHVPFSCGHENGEPADPVFSKQEYESHPIISTDTTSAKPREIDGKALLYTADKSYQIGFRDGVASVKPAEWSEEDEKTINDACCWIAEYAGYLMDKNYGKASMLMGLTDKLKSLRPSWKPSEEQMAMLLAVINEPNNAGAESCHLALKSLHEHLKKLM